MLAGRLKAVHRISIQNFPLKSQKIFISEIAQGLLYSLLP